MTATIINGDCRDVLPGVKADVLITDPPWPNNINVHLVGHDRPLALLREALDAASDQVRSVVIVLRNDCDPRFLTAVPDRWPFFHAAWLQYALPCWYGRRMGGNEVAYCFGEPPPSRKGNRVLSAMCPVKAQPVSKKDGHPCPRALEHMEWLVEKFTAPDDMIVDPFAGTCTTGVAAVRLEREAVMIEVVSEYCDIGRDRIGREFPLFADQSSANG